MIKAIKLVALSVIYAGVLTACGGDKSADKDEAGGSCSEKTEIQMTFAETPSLQNFKMTKSIGVKAGWQYSETKCAKYTIYFANYQVEPNMFLVSTPEKPGEILIGIDICGKLVKHGEKLAPIEPGEYLFGGTSADNNSMSVGVFAQGESFSNFAYLDRVEGKATITHVSDKKICGTVEIKNAEGDMIKASFSSDIEKDIMGDFEKL